MILLYDIAWTGKTLGGQIRWERHNKRVRLYSKWWPEIPLGTYDNVAKARYEVPDYWTIGEVYERLIEDISGDDTQGIIDSLMGVYGSWISDAISNYNTDFYYQPREYIYQCYVEGQICA